MRSPIAALLLAVACIAAAQAPTKPARVALVIGNAAYASAPLPNPVNDAADMAKALENAGFTVIRRENASLKEMHLALREFGDRLGKTSTGVFYFAGHGVQVRGRNYLLPVDADIAREDEVAFQSLDLAAVTEKLDSARNPVNIVILDACRDNPFGTRFQASAKGLAQVEAPPGTLIAFATAPGAAAADGGGRNGLYTGHLLAEMRKPGAPIEETFRNVRAAVRRDSKGAQVPWESTSLESEFVFVKATAPAPVVASAPVPAPAKIASSISRRPASLTMPPAFMPGDTWTWRVKNLLDGSEVTRTQGIREIQGEKVLWGNGTTGDLLGNMTHGPTLGVMFDYKPSTYHFVFPLRSGAVYDLAFFQESTARNFDAKVKLTIGEEADIDTQIGKFHAIRIHREVRYTPHREGEAREGRGGAGRAGGGGAGRGTGGVNSWDYWYSAQVKRWVRAETQNVTNDGKVLSHESWELVSFDVR
jgi:hypothetical protein